MAGRQPEVYGLEGYQMRAAFWSHLLQVTAVIFIPTLQHRQGLRQKPRWCQAAARLPTEQDVASRIPRVCLTVLVSHPTISKPCGAKQPRTLQSIVGHLGAANSQRWRSRGLPDGLQHLQGFKKLVQINWPLGLPLA